MELSFVFRFALATVFVLGYLSFPSLCRLLRTRRYTRGRQLLNPKKKNRPIADGLRWGNSFLPASAAVRHFLVVGTTGSGKSIVQRMLMKEPLLRIKPGSDHRALIFDAKGDTTRFLRHIGVQCPVFNLNPFTISNDNSNLFAWDISKDITSVARAQNLASSLLPSETSGNNQYFTDAARQVLIGIVESLITHSPFRWQFSDLVYISLSKERTRQVLERDSRGQEVLDSFFGDERTAYQVFTTIVSRMAYYRPVAGLWQKQEQRISVREWLNSNSILLLGSNATVKTSLDAINQQIYRVIVEEIDIQTNSEFRRTWIWIDEARLAGSLLHRDLTPYLAVKGRSRGVALVLAFQDIDGFREAAGERIANEIVAQCSHKALLRMESESSASWATRTLGQYETIEVFHSNNSSSNSTNKSEQRVQRDAVLASEFFCIPETNTGNGLTGYFVSPRYGASRCTVPPQEISETFGEEHDLSSNEASGDVENNQWLDDWSDNDRNRLNLKCEIQRNGQDQTYDRPYLKFPKRLDHRLTTTK